MYEDSERFYVFLLCLICKHVISRSYCDFITESDEAFALLILDNNAMRYGDIIKLGNSEKNLWVKPKYTRIGSDRRLQGRG